ncbi:MAG: hypothetical protein KDD53_10095, partial [Bdellovibrionales bacterium]|nr:hypothetical protein [Bdellovibrionales bacterium]
MHVPTSKKLRKFRTLFSIKSGEIQDLLLSAIAMPWNIDLEVQRSLSYSAPTHNYINVHKSVAKYEHSDSLERSPLKMSQDIFSGALFCRSSTGSVPLSVA